MPKKHVVDIQPGGRSGKRIRKAFNTKAEADNFKAYALRCYQEGKEWNPGRDKRKLDDLIELWHQSHGISLRDGDGRKRILFALSSSLSNPVANQVRDRFLIYRTKALQSGKAAASLNNELAYLRALFNELTRMGQWTGENPLGKVRRLPVDQVELTYLSDDQIIVLMQECDESSNPSVGAVLRLCLACGLRWSEAEGVTVAHLQGGNLLIPSHHAKNRKARSIPVDRCIRNVIRSHPCGFVSCYSAFREAVERAGIKLPKGQLSHVLRHTFASHFLQKGGNIRVLQRILDHRSLETTMRYAHFAPDHLQQAVLFNPLSIG